MAKPNTCEWCKCKDHTSSEPRPACVAYLRKVIDKLDKRVEALETKVGLTTPTEDL